MLVYKDRWFCTHYETCKDSKICPRPLTQEVKDAARKW